jgi:hypothetical protein
MPVSPIIYYYCTGTGFFYVFAQIRVRHQMQRVTGPVPARGTNIFKDLRKCGPTYEA